MDEKSKDTIGPANFGRHGVLTIRALNRLLRDKGGPNSKSDELTLKVPLLGKLHVRRKHTSSADSTSGQLGAAQALTLDSTAVNLPMEPVPSIPLLHRGSPIPIRPQHARMWKMDASRPPICQMGMPATNQS